MWDTKHTHFDSLIQEISVHNKCLRNLMSWVRKKSIPSHESIRHRGCHCNTLNSLFSALHDTYSLASDRQPQSDILNSMDQRPPIEWPPFSKQELLDTIKDCSNQSAPSPDYITWQHLKHILVLHLTIFLWLANACMSSSTWPSYFKELTSVVISKPNKAEYSTLALFHSIVLLNMTSKLIEKMIAKHLQFYTVTNALVDSFQMGGILQRYTEDTGLALVHIIKSG